MNQEIKGLLLAYEWVLKTMTTKLTIIQEAHKHTQGTSPIGQITGRIKTPESIEGKLKKKSLPITEEAIKANLKDVAGMRIICPYTKDIYELAGILRNMPEVRVLKEKDYVTHPKPSGYRSYHMILELPIYHSGKQEHLPIEIQIRTEGMNFWSTLEHQVKYKYQADIPKHLSDELVICANKIAELDERMFLIYDIISLINE